MQHCTQDAKETPFGILGTPNDLDSGTCQPYSSILTSDPTFLTFLSKTGLKHGVIAVKESSNSFLKFPPCPYPQSYWIPNQPGICISKDMTQLKTDTVGLIHIRVLYDCRQSQAIPFKETWLSILLEEVPRSGSWTTLRSEILTLSHIYLMSKIWVFPSINISLNGNQLCQLIVWGQLSWTFLFWSTSSNCHFIWVNSRKNSWLSVHSCPLISLILCLNKLFTNKHIKCYRYPDRPKFPAPTQVPRKLCTTTFTLIITPLS
jgi:hypothetical protein